MHTWVYVLFFLFSSFLIAGEQESFHMKKFNKLTKDLNLSPETRAAFHKYINMLGPISSKDWWLEDIRLIPELLNKEQATHTYFFGIFSNPRNQDLADLYETSTEIIYLFYGHRRSEAYDALALWYTHMRKFFIELPVEWPAETKRRVKIIANSGYVKGVAAILGVLVGQGISFGTDKLTSGIINSLIIN